MDFSFKELKGFSIQKCLRHFNNYDSSHIPAELRELEADGTILLLFSNETSIIFRANTETFSIEIENRNVLDVNDFTDITKNKFWEHRIGKTIQDIEFLFGKLEQPYGIKFYLENNCNFTIEYLSESNYEFDAIIIRNA
ncbi:hypothetical protein SAMN05444377_11746 [Flavobacterium fontis]|uniref:Uncharacterized protein n=1 Tax=Flavobacterium fontis TaxID=1124188 RepID=A0A1M5E3K1_9FLAO|nr:hypothetical protein [Flavobacterium fontis]SHF73631.1 hypothetical protein SAMN05444377_11746 [Flavobacterium fontis]